jgi:hypothetical protein
MTKCSTSFVRRRLTAVATSLDFIDMENSTRSMFSLTKNLSVSSSLKHCVATAHVVRTFAPHLRATLISVRTMGAGFALVVRNTFAPRTSHNCGNNDNACVALVSQKTASVLSHCIVPAPIIRHLHSGK